MAECVAYFAGGCFWGVEWWFDRQDGVVEAVSGYMGGEGNVSPTYEEVCSGRTGHLETVRVRFDPEKVSYRELLELFFEIHDPTQRDGQGPDVGPQYRSAIFYVDESQAREARSVIAELREQGLDVVTAVRPAQGLQFFEAEPYHQDYYARRGQAPVCHRRVRRFAR